MKKMVINCEPLSELPASFTKRHQRGMAIPDLCVVKSSDARWQVTSQSSKISFSYEVSKQIDSSCKNDFCYQKCLDPSCHDLCSHMYRCLCLDNSGLCKHIHKVHSMECRSLPIANRGSHSEIHSSQNQIYACPNNADQNNVAPHSQLVKDCSILMEDLSKLMTDPKSTHLMRHLKKTLKELLNQFKGILSQKTVERLANMTKDKSA